VKVQKRDMIMRGVLNVSFSIPFETYSMDDINQMLSHAGFVDPRCYEMSFKDFEDDEEKES
jgi:hypothetical protein